MIDFGMTNFYHSARHLIESRIIRSATYCNQILLAPLHINNTLNTSVIWIIRLLLSLLGPSKVILLCGRHLFESEFYGKMFFFLLQLLLPTIWSGLEPRPSSRLSKSTWSDLICQIRRGGRSPKLSNLLGRQTSMKHSTCK